MQDLKEILVRIAEAKKERKKIKASLIEALQQSKGWMDAQEERRNLKAKIGQIELSLLEPYKPELDRLDQLKISIGTDEQLVTDMALTMLMKGQTVEVTDADGQKQQPTFKVSFKQLRLL